MNSLSPSSTRRILRAASSIAGVVFLSWFLWRSIFLSIGLKDTTLPFSVLGSWKEQSIESGNINDIPSRLIIFNEDTLFISLNGSHPIEYAYSLIEAGQVRISNERIPGLLIDFMRIDDNLVVSGLTASDEKLVFSRTLFIDWQLLSYFFGAVLLWYIFGLGLTNLGNKESDRQLRKSRYLVNLLLLGLGCLLGYLFWVLISDWIYHQARYLIAMEFGCFLFLIGRQGGKQNDASRLWGRHLSLGLSLTLVLLGLAGFILQVAQGM